MNKITTSSKYRPEIDGLRAVAVTAVILCHAGFEVFAGGFLGVDVFFVISGYLITRLILNEMNEGRFSILNFYERRARRILPVLFFVMAVCLVAVSALFIPSDARNFLKSMVATSLFSSNIFFWLDSGYFQTSSQLKPLLHTWSLAVEEQFYIIFPFVLLFSRKWNIRSIWIMLGLICVGSFALGHWGSFYRSGQGAFFLLPSRGWELLFGVFVAFYLEKPHRRFSGRLIAQLASITGLLLVIYSFIKFSEDTPTPSSYTLVPTIGTALIIIFSVKGTIIHALLRTRLFVGLGLISYSAYLWHQPLFAFTRYLTPGELSKLLLLGLCAVTLPLSYVSWRYIEQPFRQRLSISRATVFRSTLAVSLAFCVAGMGVLQYGGNMFFNQSMEFVGNIEEHSQYVWASLNSNRRKTFSKNSSMKLLIVGDSFSGDLANILDNAPGAQNIEIRSLKISSGCGNLYLDRGLFSHYVRKTRRADCLSDDDLFDSLSKLLFRSADIVILAQNWKDWELSSLPDSLKVLQHEYGNKFHIFGVKGVIFDINALARLPSKHRYAITTTPRTTHLVTNRRLKRIAKENFINSFEIICIENKCPLWNEQKQLITFDGLHLTQAGAQVWGAKFPIDSLLLDRFR